MEDNTIIDYHDDDTNSNYSFDDNWIDNYINNSNQNDINFTDINLINIDDELSNIYQSEIDISDNIGITIDNPNNNIVNTIKIYFLYIDKDQGTLATMNSNVIKSIKTTHISYCNSIKKYNILQLIKEYSLCDNIEYKLLNILKYENKFTSKDLEKIIDLSNVNNDILLNKSSNFLTVYNKLDDIKIDEYTLKILSPLTSIYFIFIKSFENKKYTVIPSLKIPYYDKKCDRRTRYNKKNLINYSQKSHKSHNKSKKI